MQKKQLLFCMALPLIIFGGHLLAGKQDGQTKKLQQEGAKLYTKHCSSCHGKDGKGQGDLRQAYSKYTDETLKAYIKNPKTSGVTKMPAFASAIPEADYTALLSYVKWLGEKSKAKK